MIAHKVQFGCGANRLEGWENWDSDCDITKHLPYADETVQEVLCEHVCEHVSTPSFFRFLLECKRILKPGGILWLSLPVLDRLGDEHARDIILGHGHEAAYTEQSLAKILSLSGFSKILHITGRPEIFGHWSQIGEERDNLESARFCLTK